MLLFLLYQPPIRALFFFSSLNLYLTSSLFPQPAFVLFLPCSAPPGQEKILHSLFDECLPLLAACMMGYTNADNVLKVSVWMGARVFMYSLR